MRLGKLRIFLYNLNNSMIQDMKSNLVTQDGLLLWEYIVRPVGGRP